MRHEPKINVANPLAPDSEKKDPKFGKKVFRMVMGNHTRYKEIRNKQIFEWRKFANGEQDMQEYLDLLTADGKTLYQNISFKASPIAKKFEESVVNGFMLRKEYPRAGALSKEIQDRKDRKKADARFRMEFGDYVQQLSQEVGMPVEDPSAFVPEDIEDLDMHFTLEDKEREELLMQEMVDFTLNDNDITSMKRKFLSNIFQVNLSGFYTYIDDNGRLIIEDVDAEDAIYSNSRKELLTDDATYAGREMRMYISDIRSKFNVAPEKEEALFKLAKKYIGMYNNPAVSLESWLPDYRDMLERPYDNFLVDVVHIWWRCSKVIGYTEGKDRYGRHVFDTKEGQPEQKYKSDGRKKTGSKYVQTAYEGYFTLDGGMVLQWGEQRNVLRAGYDREQVLCPFIYIMPSNSGKLLMPSFVDRITDYIKQMDIAELKIKQAIAKHPPDGFQIDIESVLNVDLGNGELEPLTLVDIWRQTGDFFYRSKKDGENQDKVNPPIAPSFNHISNTIQTYISVYNFNLGKIRDVLGINEIADGSAAAPRIGYRFAEMQRQASNTATWSIYDAYLRVGAKLVKQIGIRIWDAINYGTVNKGYLGYLGKANIDFIKSREDLTKSSYDFKFEMGLDQGQKDALEQNVNAAIAAGVLEMPDAIRIMNVDDVYKAEKLATYLYNKRRREKIRDAQDNARQQAESAALAGQTVEQEKQNTIRIQMQAEMAKEQQRGRDDQIQEMLKGAMGIIRESFENNKPIPVEYQPFVQLALQSAATQAAKSASDTEKQVAAEQQEEMMAQLEQAVASGQLSEEEAMMLVHQQGM